MTPVIDGKYIANKIQQEVFSELQFLEQKPHLSVVVVGDDPASQIYVSRKRKVCEELGVNSELIKLPSSTDQTTVENLVKKLSDSQAVDGILVQLPLPPRLDKYKILDTIAPEKDVDCFCSKNIGKLAQGTALLKPCTPSGVVEILKHHNIPTQGKRVTVINRSLVVGQPLAVMLQQEPYNATVTVCHEHTPNLSFYTLNSDIIITAVGKYPNFQLPVSSVADKSVIIDVAVNRVGGKIFGDVVDFEGMRQKVKWITPVPGGVGLVTVACLMRNVLLCVKIRKEIP